MHGTVLASLAVATVALGAAAGCQTTATSPSANAHPPQRDLGGEPWPATDRDWRAFASENPLSSEIEAAIASAHSATVRGQLRAGTLRKTLDFFDIRDASRLARAFRVFRRSVSELAMHLWPAGRQTVRAGFSVNILGAILADRERRLESYLEHMRWSEAVKGKVRAFFGR